jgi:hypothetical protein
MRSICKVGIIFLFSACLIGSVTHASAFVNPSVSSFSQSTSAKSPLIVVADPVKRSPTFLQSVSRDTVHALDCKKNHLPLLHVSGEIESEANFKGISDLLKTSSFVLASLYASAFLMFCPVSANAAEGGASNVANSKIAKGGASTLQSGRTISITRGVNLDRSDFSNQNLKGVAFQQSIVRDANFKGSNLVGASFFDATLDGTDFEDADMTQVNLEMAQLSRANLKNAVVREMYVGGKWACII